MSTDNSRRALLRGTAVAVLVGLAGCSFGTEDGSGSGGGGGTNGGTPTQSGGRTFAFEVENAITPGVLGKKESVPNDASAKITVEVANPVRGGEDEVVFDRDFDLPPGGSTTVPEAFTTESGKAYTVEATLEPYLDDPAAPPEHYHDDTRWETGGYGIPDDTTFLVKASNGMTRDETGFGPQIEIS